MRVLRSLRKGVIVNTIVKVLAVVVIATPAMAWAQSSLELTFKGRVEPNKRTQVANQITGQVSEVHFQPGQRIERGQLIYSMDSRSFQIDVDGANAALAEARARFALAKDVADRQSELLKRGTGPEAKATQSTLEAEVAKAAVARAQAALASAELSLERTRIRAPIAGIARSIVAPGAFAEAEGGTVLGEIVQTDPALVAYQVPYTDRQKALKAVGTTSIRDLFSRIKLSLRLPSGEVFPSTGRPIFESAQLDERTGMLTTWGEFPNPDGVLIPGLDVMVLSEISTIAVGRGER
jgi:membrane fusion protein, multidrug efflux system